MRPIRSGSHRFLCGLCGRGYSIVPQISRIYTDFFDLIGRITQIFPTPLLTSWKEICSKINLQ